MMSDKNLMNVDDVEELDNAMMQAVITENKDVKERKKKIFWAKVKFISFNTYKILKDVLLILFLGIGIISLITERKKEFLNFGYMTGWSYAMRAFNYELKGVDKEVLDGKFFEWRTYFRDLTSENYGVDVFENWELKKYQSLQEIMKSIDKESDVPKMSMDSKKKQ
jgi:hypothetical protein